jgi:hypothetical protein
MPISEACWGLLIVTGSPSNSSSPLSTSRLPVIALTIVDLPAPLSPINATTSPASTSKSASIKARTWPKLRESPRRLENGSHCCHHRLNSSTWLSDLLLPKADRSR